MANSVERSCSMLVHSDKPTSANEIKEALEGNDPQAKVLAMKKAVTMLLSGESLPQLFITIVRYVLPSEDHTVQKLLLLYLVRRGTGESWGATCTLDRSGAGGRGSGGLRWRTASQAWQCRSCLFRRRRSRRRTRRASSSRRWCACRDQGAGAVVPATWPVP